MSRHPSRAIPPVAAPLPALPSPPLLGLLLLLPLLAVPAVGTAQALENVIEARLDALPALTSMHAVHLPSGRSVAVRADRPMNTLSVIKIPIMVLAFKDAEAGLLDLDERYTIRPADLRRGSGLLQRFQPGLAPTWRDLVEQMIVTSDNTATDILIERLGLERVNRMLEELGYRETRLQHTTGELFRFTWIDLDPANASLSDREVFERGFPSDEGASERSFRLQADAPRWLGRSTARETTRLLRQLHDGELANAEHTREMIGILRGQFYRSRLPRYLGGRASVAHKTGDWPPVAGNDVGILYYEGGPTIVSVYTNQNTGDFGELEAALGRIAELLVEAWR